jgi:signal transduction histidine kinase
MLLPMRKNSSFLFGLLPAAVVLFSIVAASSFFRFYLQETAWQFAEAFEKQNLVAIESGDVFALSSRLNSLGASVRANCVSAARGGISFFDQKTGPCSSGFLRERVWVETKNQDGIRIDFTLRLPRSLETAGAGFLAIQLSLLGLLFLGVRRVERVRSEGARKLAELAAQVAHDIRSPLAALDSLLPRLKGTSEEDRALASGAAERIRLIAEDLLARNRGDSPEGSTGASAVVVLGEAVKSVVAEKRLKHPEGCSIEFSSAAGPRARVEPKEFARALSNLIENAVEAAGASGTVRVTVETRGADAVVTIADDGPGIPEEILAKLGERGATFGKQGGSGLGLYHAREAAKRWGGRLVVESEEGRGTEVRLELPGAGRPRAALIDDDPLVRATWAAAAKRAGVECRTFADIASFEAADVSKDAAVYLDVNLGGVSGLDAARTLDRRGYREIHLATGEELSRDERPDFVRSVRGKEPPWPAE